MHIDSIFTFFLIAVALAMDAFAVSVSSGIIIPNLSLRNALKIALFFGIFQAVMPVIGWLAGTGLKDFIQAVDHYIAFGLLAVIGIKMIYEAFKKREAEQSINPLNFGVLLILSVATSIDALAVGLSFALLSIKILTPVIIIGITTFFISLAGVSFGDKLGHFFKNRVQVIGGIILIGLGIRIFVEHIVKGI